MSLTRQNSKYISLAGLALLIGLAVAGAAVAECTPGQMQEANLAYQSAVQFLDAKQWDQAIARLQSIVQVCPEHVEATRGIAIAHSGKGEEDQALLWFSKVVGLRGDDVEAGDFANVAMCYTKLKKYKEARAEYMKAQQLAPDDCGVLFNLGVLHNASGFSAQAVEVLEHALEVCPQVSDQILPQLSKAADKASEQQKAAGNNERAQYYAGLMAKYGGQAGGSTTYDMVKQKMAEKKYAEAVTLLEQMLAKDPTQANATLTLARARDAAGDKSGSIEAYQQYLALNPSDAQATGTMLQVMVETGQCTRAKSEAAAAAQRLESQGRSALASVMYSWGLALECTQEYDQAREKFVACASSGNAKYAGPGQIQVDRMEDLKARQEAEQKKARQGG